MRRSRLTLIAALMTMVVAACSVSATTAPSAPTTPSPTQPSVTANGSIGVATPGPTTAATPVAGCDSVAKSCMGALSAGTHKPDHFVPAFSFTVADGWQNTLDEAGIFYLSQTADTTGDTIVVWDNPIMAKSDPACDGPRQPGIGSSVSDVVGYLTANPGLTATTPKPVTVGGLSGQELDIVVAPSWTQPCPKFDGTAYAGKPFVMIVTEAKESLDGRWWGLAGPAFETWRIYILDGGAKGTIMIAVDGVGSSFAAFAKASEPILASLDFTP